MKQRLQKFSRDGLDKLSRWKTMATAYSADALARIWHPAYGALATELLIACACDLVLRAYRRLKRR